MASTFILSDPFDWSGMLDLLRDKVSSLDWFDQSAEESD